MQAARALALLRGRGYVAVADVRDLAPDVLRHRLVLSYDALTEDVTADEILERVLGAVEEPPADHLATRRTSGRLGRRDDRPPAARRRSGRPRRRQGPGPLPHGLLAALDLVVARRAAGALPGDRRAAGLGAGTELAQLRPYEVGDDVRQIDAAATARTGEPHVRLHVPERTLTTWIVLDVSPSMAFGTAERLKSDVAEGVALVLGRLAVRRAGRVALMTFGAGRPRLVPPRASKPGVVALRRALAEGCAVDGRPDRHALGGRAAADRQGRDASRARRR